MSSDYESFIFLKKTQSLKEAMEALNHSKLHICFVVNDEQKLIGSLTDGDIRRAFLTGATLESAVERFMNQTPKSIPDGLTMEEVAKVLDTWGIRQLPVIDDKGRVVRVETVEKVIHLFQKKNRVVLMVGGFGKRLSPLTDNIPKPLLKIAGTPILEHIINRFKELGFYKFTLCVNYRSDMIIDYIGDGSRFGVEVSYIQESEPLGTCGALSLLKEKPTEPIIVMNGDLLTRVNFSELLNFHSKSRSLATMCVREYQIEVPFGVVKCEGSKILSISEKPKEVNLINAGIYVLSPEALDYVEHNKYKDMPTLFDEILKKDQLATCYTTKDYWLDIGRMEDFHRAQADFMKFYKL